MSYTIFSKEVTKWLKTNGLPWKGTNSDTQEAIQARLTAWQTGSQQIFEQWLKEERYRELISCAHGGWYPEKVFFEPLALYFVKKREFACLQFLCERDIRLNIEDMLKLIKYECEQTTIENCRDKALNHIERYRSYLELMEIAPDYLEIVESIKTKVIDSSVKKKDLKNINNKL